MKQILVFLAALVLACSASAALDTRGLTPAQVQALEQQVQALQAKGPSVQETLSLASTWGQQAATAAEGFARALGIAAREIGVSANDFLQTPAGVLTAAVIIWKVAGAALVSMAYGTVVLWVGLAAAWMLARHIATKEFALVPYSRLWGLWSGQRKVRVYRPFSDYEDGDVVMTVVAVAIAVATLFAAGALIRP